MIVGISSVPVWANNIRVPQRRQSGRTGDLRALRSDDLPELLLELADRGELCLADPL